MSKIKDHKGFTLVETLLAVLILLMVSMVVVAGIPAAQRAYIKVVDTANAQVLFSTTVTRLRQELSAAREVPGGGDEYVNDFTGLKIRIFNDPDGKGIKVGYTRLKADGSEEQRPDKADKVVEELLVSEKAATDKLITSFETLTLSDGVFTVKNLAVKKGDKELIKQDVVIRTLAE